MRRSHAILSRGPTVTYRLPSLFPRLGHQQEDAACQEVQTGKHAVGHVRAIVARFTGSDASLPDLMIVACVVILFAGRLRFSDLTQVSVQHDLLVISETRMTLEIPRSKTDQEGLGHTISITRTRGSACPVALLERLLTLGAYIRAPASPQRTLAPPLRRIKKTAHGHAIQHITGTASSPTPA